MSGEYIYMYLRGSARVDQRGSRDLLPHHLCRVSSLSVFNVDGYRPFFYSKYEA